MSTTATALAPNPIVRSSRTQQGRYRITVCEFATGEIILSVDDARSYIQEEIALSSYVEAYEIHFDDHRGWMAGGREIPYLDSY